MEALMHCNVTVKGKGIKRCWFIVWYQVWRPIIRLHILPPGHWTCLFICYFNCTKFCSHFGTLNLSYTLPSLSYQVLIFTWVKWNIWGWSALPKDTTLKQCPKHGEHTVLQPFWRIELIIHITISVLPGTHFHLSQVKRLRVKCFAQGHNIETMSQDWDGRNILFLWKSCTKWFETARQAATSAECHALLNHCAMSLSKVKETR